MNIWFQLKRLNSTLGQRDTQWSHDIKRRDAELSKLKERLMRLLTEKSTRGVAATTPTTTTTSGNNSNSCSNSMIEPSGMEMSYFLDKPDGKQRARWRNESGEKQAGSRIYILTFYLLSSS